MTLTAATFSVLLLLYPGLLASAVLNVARRPGSVETTQRLVETLVFALIVTVVLGGVLDGPAALSPIGFDGERLVREEGAVLWFVLSSVLAVGLALATSWVLSADRHMRVLRRLALTDRSSYESMWHHVFAREGDRYLLVHLDDGRLVRGYASHYANDAEEGAVFLDQPAWVELIDGAYAARPVEQYGMLVPAKTIRLIEFQYNEEELRTREAPPPDGAA